MSNVGKVLAMGDEFNPRSKTADMITHTLTIPVLEKAKVGRSLGLLITRLVRETIAKEKPGRWP